MNDHRPQRALAFALSLAVTLAIFSGVSQLGAPGQVGAVLAKVAAGSAACS